MSNNDLIHKLNLETGKISWPELQRYFARGVVIVVAPGIDLIEVATAISGDDKNTIEELMNSGKLVRACDDNAIHWEVSDPLFWAVVVAPWVLVQEIEA